MGQICQRAVKLVWLTRSASADGYDRDTFQVTSSQPKRLPAPDNEHRREGTSGLSHNLDLGRERTQMTASACDGVVSNRLLKQEIRSYRDRQTPVRSAGFQDFTDLVRVTGNRLLHIEWKYRGTGLSPRNAITEVEVSEIGNQIFSFAPPFISCE